MQPIEHYEDRSLALLKSVVVEVVAKHLGGNRLGDCPHDHPMVKGVDLYVKAAMAGKPVPKPADKTDENNPELIAYLAYLQHRKAHASIGESQVIADEIDAQYAEYKTDNPMWQAMYDAYVQYYWQYPQHAGGVPQYRSWQDPEFGKGSYSYGEVEWRIPSDATVAILGDFGTGTDVAGAVLLGALSFKPDVILHVGDVYFSGTEHETQHNYVAVIQDVLRVQKVQVPVYSVPGNHEYFSGLIPFLGCLDSNVLNYSEAQRQRASFFKLVSEDGGWQFLGLDTAFHGHHLGVSGHWLAQAMKDLNIDPSKASDPSENPPMVYLRPDEVDWHHYHLNQFGGRSVLLSHHQLYSANKTVGVAQSQKDGKPNPADRNRPGVNTALWYDLGQYFNKVAAWFWGHEHNLVIYANGYRPSDWPASSGSVDDRWKTLPKGRCVGHSALPIEASTNPYQANNPIPLIDESTKLGSYNGWYNRGFAILKLNGKGQPAKATYYQTQGANPEPLKLYEETIE